MLKRCDLPDLVPDARHWMLTIGLQRFVALRVTRGRLDRKGRWHAWQPCIFLLVGGKRATR